MWQHQNDDLEECHRAGKVLRNDLGALLLDSFGYNTQTFSDWCTGAVQGAKPSMQMWRTSELPPSELVGLI